MCYAFGWGREPLSDGLIGYWLIKFVSFAIGLSLGYFLCAAVVSLLLFALARGATAGTEEEVKEETKQLEALKKNASLSAVRKVEQVREIGSSFDERLKPLISPEQQQKFAVVREQLRGRFIEKMTSEVESDVKSWFTEKSVE